MKFTELELQSWKRGQMFYYFSKMAPTGYSLTVKIDITHLLSILKTLKLKFFPAYIWLVTKNLNSQIEFKIAEKDGKLGYYDKLTPLYAHFHKDDETFSLMWTEYDDCFKMFYDEYIRNADSFGENHGVLSQVSSLPPSNAYTVSCIPWLSFEHFAVHSFENKQYYFPSVEAGKFYDENGKILLPLSITCHHATTDGWHIKKFIEDLQNDINCFENLV